MLSARAVFCSLRGSSDVPKTALPSCTESVLTSFPARDTWEGRGCGGKQGCESLEGVGSSGLGLKSRTQSFPGGTLPRVRRRAPNADGSLAGWRALPLRGVRAPSPSVMVSRPTRDPTAQCTEVEPCCTGPFGPGCCGCEFRTRGEPRVQLYFCTVVIPCTCWSLPTHSSVEEASDMCLGTSQENRNCISYF